MSFVVGNPINYIDPTGYITQGSEEIRANQIVANLLKFRVRLQKDWGQGSTCNWNQGEWTVNELVKTQTAILDFASAVGLQGKIQDIVVDQKNINSPGATSLDGKNVTVWTREFSKWTVVHELGHVWDLQHQRKLSEGLVTFTGGRIGSNTPCDKNKDPDRRFPGCNTALYNYGDIPSHGSDINFNPLEDFAESVAAYVYPARAKENVGKDYKGTGYEKLLYYDSYIGTLRWQYINGLVKGKFTP